jgi:hypothetical protein
VPEVLVRAVRGREAAEVMALDDAGRAPSIVTWRPTAGASPAPSASRNSRTTANVPLPAFANWPCTGFDRRPGFTVPKPSCAAA